MEATPPILVIGGGPAGTFAAIAAKKQNPDARVILLTEEPCEPYEKPPLSKGVLLGKVSPADAPIAGPGGLAAHGVALEPCARCLAIDREARERWPEDFETRTIAQEPSDQAASALALGPLYDSARMTTYGWRQLAWRVGRSNTAL